VLHTTKWVGRRITIYNSPRKSQGFVLGLVACWNFGQKQLTKGEKWRNKGS